MGVSTSTPQRSALSSGLRFLSVGGLSYLVDITVLYVLHGVLGAPLLLATAAALSTGLGVNFGLNRTIVFPSDGLLASHLARYLVLVGVNYVLTLGIVAGVVALGVNYLLAKTIATACNAVLNYLAYRFWVFR